MVDEHPLLPLEWIDQIRDYIDSLQQRVSEYSGYIESLDSICNLGEVTSLSNNLPNPLKETLLAG